MLDLQRVFCSIVFFFDLLLQVDCWSIFGPILFRMPVATEPENPESTEGNVCCFVLKEISNDCISFALPGL